MIWTRLVYLAESDTGKTEFKDCDYMTFSVI